MLLPPSAAALEDGDDIGLLLAACSDQYNAHCRVSCVVVYVPQQLAQQLKDLNFFHISIVTRFGGSILAMMDKYVHQES